MKACSFLPAATQMIYDMGLQDSLTGVTFECPPAALQEKPVVVHCVLEGKTYSSEEIDRIFSASKAEGRSLYYVDEPLLASLSPDIIFTQDVCEVCQIDTACTSAAIAKLEKQPELVPITPSTLDDVFQSAVTIATALGKEEAAYRYLAGLQERLDHVVDLLRATKAPLRKVMILEWTEPLYNCGHWIPYQAFHAGGVDMLSHPGGDSIVTDWQKLVRYDPEVLVIAPCGFNIGRTMQEMEALTRRAEWNNLRAVREGRVYLADYDLFTQPSAGTLVAGIELLASFFHPELFAAPSSLTGKHILYSTSGVAV